MKTVYGLYDSKQNNICVGIFDRAKDVADYLDIKVDSIYVAISTTGKVGKKIGEDYKIKKIEFEEEVI